MAKDALTPKQLTAIDALMTCSSVEDAARACGVNRATMFRWLADASFCDALRKAQSDAIAQSARRLATMTGAAVGVLAAALHDGASETQRRAANDVLAHAARLHELGEIERRLAALEAAQEATQHGK